MQQKDTKNAILNDDIILFNLSLALRGENDYQVFKLVMLSGSEKVVVYLFLSFRLNYMIHQPVRHFQTPRTERVGSTELEPGRERRETEGPNW